MRRCDGQGAMQDYLRRQHTTCVQAARESNVRGRAHLSCGKSRTLGARVSTNISVRKFASTYGGSMCSGILRMNSFFGLFFFGSGEGGGGGSWGFTGHAVARGSVEGVIVTGRRACSSCVSRESAAYQQKSANNTQKAVCCQARSASQRKPANWLTGVSCAPRPCGRSDAKLRCSSVASCRRPRIACSEALSSR